MLQNKTLLQFLLFFVLIYTAFLFIGKLESVNKMYINGFAKLGNSFFDTFKGKARTKFETESQGFEKESIHEVVISFTTEKLIQEAAKGIAPRGKKTELNTWNFSYLPLAFIIALILATPINWKRKLLALLLGVLLMDLFIYFKVYIFLFDKLQSFEDFNIAELSSFWANALKKIATLFVHIGTSMFVGVLIWLIVTFRKNDWKNFLPNSN